MFIDSCYVELKIGNKGLCDAECSASTGAETVGRQGGEMMWRMARKVREK